jgi:integrase
MTKLLPPAAGATGADRIGGNPVVSSAPHRPSAATTSARIMTLADVVAALETVDGLSASTRAEIRRDLLRYARHSAQPLAEIPASAEAVRRSLQTDDAPRRFKIAASPHGDKRWRNFRRNVLRALELAAAANGAAAPHPWSPAWQRLRGLVVRELGRPAWAGVARLARLADAQGIAPEYVDEHTLGHLREDLADERRRADARMAAASPVVVVRASVRRWNLLVGQLAAHGWPPRRLSLPSDTRSPDRTLAPGLPPALQSALARYRDWATGAAAAGDRPVSRYAEASPLARPEPLRMSTASGHVRALTLVARTLLAAGTDPATLTSIASLITPGALRATLEATDERHAARLPAGSAPDPSSSYPETLARRIIAVAQHYVGIDEHELTQLRQLARQARPRGRRTGVSAHNLGRLLQFDDARIARFLQLPDQLAAEYERALTAAAGTVTLASARLLQQAAALAILRVCPLRRGNLARLRWGCHFIPPGIRGQHAWLTIPAAETKTSHEFARPIAPERWSVLERYMREAQPRLRPAGDDGNDFIFPSSARHGAPMGLDHVSQLVAGIVRARLGVAVHLHLVRHLVGWIILRQDPSALSVVSRVLEHASMAVTERHYAELDGSIAAARAEAILARAAARYRGA